MPGNCRAMHSKILLDTRCYIHFLSWLAGWWKREGWRRGVDERTGDARWWFPKRISAETTRRDEKTIQGIKVQGSGVNFIMGNTLKHWSQYEAETWKCCSLNLAFYFYGPLSWCETSLCLSCVSLIPFQKFHLIFYFDSFPSKPEVRTQVLVKTVLTNATDYVL